MTGSRYFPIETILTLTTNTILQKSVSAIVACAEHVAGHPIFQHELATREAVEAIGRLILGQHPELAQAEEFRVGDTRIDEYVAGYLARAREKFGAKIELQQGEGFRLESPLETFERLFPDKEVTVVTR